MKLHQLLAILTKVKNNCKKQQTEIYHQLQKPALFKGLSRVYEPKEDEGFVYPAESKVIQTKTKDLISKFEVATTELFNMLASQDYTNAVAKADLVVEGKTLIKDVPVTALLTLESQLQDVKTFINALPVLDLDQQWSYDANKGCYVTNPKTSVKTKKITKPVVFYEATKEHPAQVKEVSEDIIEGIWTALEFSSGLPQDIIDNMLRKVDLLITSVVVAREKANDVEVLQVNMGEPIFNYLFTEL